MKGDALLNRDGFRVLPHMRVLFVIVNAEIQMQGPAQPVFREHTHNRFFEQIGGVFFPNFLRGGGFDSARIPCVMIVYFVIPFLPGQPDFGGVDDDHVVAGVHMRGENRFGFPPDDLGGLTGNATQGLIGGVDEHPFFYKVAFFGRVGLH